MLLFYISKLQLIHIIRTSRGPAYKGFFYTSTTAALVLVSSTQEEHRIAKTETITRAKARIFLMLFILFSPFNLGALNTAKCKLIFGVCDMGLCLPMKKRVSALRYVQCVRVEHPSEGW